MRATLATALQKGCSSWGLAGTTGIGSVETFALRATWPTRLASAWELGLRLGLGLEL